MPNGTTTHLSQKATGLSLGAPAWAAGDSRCEGSDFCQTTYQHPSKGSISQNLQVTAKSDNVIKLLFSFITTICNINFST